MSTTNNAKVIPDDVKKRHQWTLAGDLLTSRTALFMQEKLVKLEQTKKEQAMLSTNPTFPTNEYQTQPCDHCLLTHHHCVCDEFPSRQEVTNKLSDLMDVVVYTHSNEVNSLSASNTARFLPRHGAYPVIMGDIRGESILRNIILSRPRDSVFVLFPTQTALTPDDFMRRFSDLQKNKNYQHPFLNYPPIRAELLPDIIKKNEQIDEMNKISQSELILIPETRGKKVNLKLDNVSSDIITRQKERVYIENQITDLIDDNIAAVFPTFCSSREFYQQKNHHIKHKQQQQQNNQQNENNNSVPTKPLVIVLDGTWSNAKTLDRRLNLLIAEALNTNKYNESEKLLKTPSLDVSGSPVNEIDPKTYLHRVRVTRAIRGDIGQLRRLQTAERASVTEAGLNFKAVKAIVTPDAVRSNEAVKEPNEEGNASPQQSPKTEQKFTVAQNSSIRKNSVILDDDTSIEDTSGGRVSTLHAFLVMLEELYDLPVITSHRDLDVQKYEKSLSTVEQHVVLSLVGDFSTILQAMVIGYHTQSGLQKGQLLDPETRQIVKQRYQKFLDTKAAGRRERLDLFLKSKEDKDHIDQNQGEVSSDGEVIISNSEKKQRVNQGDDDCQDLVSINNTKK
jgi:DTW domain-containing protein YfiP